MQRPFLLPILFALALLASACETTVDIDVPTSDDIVLTSFVAPSEPVTVNVYGCVAYTDSALYSSLEQVDVTLTLDDSLSLTQTIADGALSTTFASIVPSPGSTIAISATTPDGTLLTASTTVLDTVAIDALDTLTTTAAPDELTLRLTFTDPAQETNYYHVVLVRHAKLISGQTTSERISGDYYDYLFVSAAQSSIITSTDANTTGIFNDEQIDGRTYTLTFSVSKSLLTPADNEHYVSLEVRLYHHTFDFYEFVRTASRASDYLVLPVFARTQVASNVSGGYGIVTSIVYDARTIDFNP